MSRLRALTSLLMSGVAGYVIGRWAGSGRQRHVELDAVAVDADAQRLGEGHASLTRMATLVAGGARPEELFAAVAEELRRVLPIDLACMSRYESDGVAAVLGAWSRTGAAGPVAVGDRLPLQGRNVYTLVYETGRPVRLDDYADASTEAAERARSRRMQAAVGVPITVEGLLWGVVFVSSQRAQPLPADTEARLGELAGLVATAIDNARARGELRGFAEEQAALRRVATLAARGVRPEKLFSTIAAEVGRLLATDLATMGRYDPDNVVTAVGVWSATGSGPAPGDRTPLGGENVTTRVRETGRPARIDDFTDRPGAIADVVRAWGIRSSVGAPITVEGRLWGVMVVSSTRERSLPSQTEARLAGFTELTATAIANAEGWAQVIASRARIVAAADQVRRRIERDLHDGAQQRLVSLTLQLQAAQAAVPAQAHELATRLDDMLAETSSVLDELRELARGIHPVALAEGGLPSALQMLARRCTVPVRLDVRIDRRLPEPVEIAAYYLVAEALTNVAKHAHASTVLIEADTGVGDVLVVRIRDDGRGGANLTGGSGLVGLHDRVETLGGRVRVNTVPGAGTTVEAMIPLDTAHSATRWPSHGTGPAGA